MMTLNFFYLVMNYDDTRPFSCVAALCQRRFAVASISFPELSDTSLFQGMFQFSFSGSFPGIDINA